MRRPAGETEEDRSRFRHHGCSGTSAMGIVMAIGIFAAFSLPQLPFYSPWLARLVMLELFVIWLYIAGSYFASAVRRHFRMHVAHPLRRFAIGTWVAGTATLAIVAAHALPEPACSSRRSRLSPSRFTRLTSCCSCSATIGCSSTR